MEKQRAAKEKKDAEAEAAQNAVKEKDRADKEKQDEKELAEDAQENVDTEEVETIDTQPVDDDNQRAVETGAEAENVFITGKWTPTEINILSQSLILNGSRTTYETMSKHVLTRTKSAITSYYDKNKSKLLRGRKGYAKNNIGNDLTVDDGIDNDGGVNLKQTHLDDPSIDMDKVIAGETVDTLDIIEGAIARANTNHTVFLATYADLNDFVKCFFVELKEQFQTKDKEVRIASVGTFRQNINEHLVITDQPKTLNTE